MADSRDLEEGFHLDGSRFLSRSLRRGWRRCGLCWGAVAVTRAALAHGTMAVHRPMAIPVMVTGPILVAVVVGDRRWDIGRVNGRRRNVNRPVGCGLRINTVTIRIEPVTVPIAKAIKAVMVVTVAVPSISMPSCLSRRGSQSIFVVARLNGTENRPKT